MPERERVIRRYVKSDGRVKVCDDWHELHGGNIYRFDTANFCRKCVESGRIVPVSKRVVYFVADGIGHVKIGVATSVESRLAGLQGANALPLTLLAYTPGGADLERELHQRFREHHVRGEWFRLVSEIEDHIAGVIEAEAKRPKQKPPLPDHVIERKRMRRARALLGLPPT
jgi:hypothetical protein